jgi:hypothetical protein
VIFVLDATFAAVALGGLGLAWLLIDHPAAELPAVARRRGRAAARHARSAPASLAAHARAAARRVGATHRAPLGPGRHQTR